MTREQLYEIFEDVEQHRIYCKEQFADAILSLPLDVPTDKEMNRQIFNKMSEMKPFTKDYIPTSTADYMYFIARWMKEEIIKRNKK